MDGEEQEEDDKDDGGNVCVAHSGEEKSQDKDVRIEIQGRGF